MENDNANLQYEILQEECKMGCFLMAINDILGELEIFVDGSLFTENKKPKGCNQNTTMSNKKAFLSTVLHWSWCAIVNHSEDQNKKINY